MDWLMVLLGAAVGAPARFLIDQFVQRRIASRFPWGTFAVNVIACAVLGFIAGAATSVPTDVQHLVGTGLCGTLSTYSTFSYETLRLTELGAPKIAVANAVLSVLVGLGVAGAAFSLASILVT